MEDKLKIFINSVFYYFDHTCKEPIDVGTPYLVDSMGSIQAEYTALIAVTGEYQGVCCFSTPKALLEEVIKSVGVSDTSHSMLLDTAGEIANTLSGNARQFLGSNFNISVPMVFKGAPDTSYLPEQAKIYAIPIEWKGIKAILGICLVQ